MNNKVIRKIIEINEEKCDGCGLCANACAEGAIKIINGKAKLVSDTYCDGLGNCIGECPQDAIKIIERESLPFDEKLVEQHLNQEHNKDLPCGCPGSAVKHFENHHVPTAKSEYENSNNVSELTNWPIQIKLAPINAPYFHNADLLIAADCIGFSFPNLHSSLIKDKILLIGCPKLDDAEMYVNKFTQIFLNNNIKSVEVAIMEVPCCNGLINIIKNALDNSEKNIPLILTKVGIRGNILNNKVSI